MGDIVNFKPSDSPHREMERKEPEAPKTAADVYEEAQALLAERHAQALLAELYARAAEGQSAVCVDPGRAIGDLYQPDKERLMRRVLGLLRDRGYEAWLNDHGVVVLGLRFSKATRRIAFVPALAGVATVLMSSMAWYFGHLYFLLASLAWTSALYALAAVRGRS